MKETRKLQDLVSVGKAFVRDFNLLGIRKVEQLVGQNPEKLYRKLEMVKGQPMDICCLDVITAAVKQAENPNLPAQQKQWYYWSRVRKSKK